MTVLQTGPDVETLLLLSPVLMTSLLRPNTYPVSKHNLATALIDSYRRRTIRLRERSILADADIFILRWTVAETLRRAVPACLALCTRVT